MSYLLIGLSQLFLGGVLLKYAVQNLLIASATGESSFEEPENENEVELQTKRKSNSLIVEETEESQK